MTCIAFDGKALAADSRVVCQTTGDYTVNKLMRIGQALYGWAGGVAEAAMVMRWIREGEDMERFPEDAARVEIGAPVIMRCDSDGIALLECWPVWMPIREEKFAIGSGSPYARSAMALGFSAEHAVLFAIERESSCGAPVQVLGL